MLMAVQKTVLCVDDEENVLRSLRRLLRKEPFRLLTAGSGQEALEVLEREPVHLIVSDYRMPGMTGTELLATVAEKYPETVRVVLSGFADAASIVDAINLGHIFRFLPKPWNDDELKANLKACLEQQELIVRNRELTEELARRNAELRGLTDRQQLLIDERTRSLQMAQEIVQALPLPLMGISRDGVIALCNQEAERRFPAAVGRMMHEVMSSDLVRSIQEKIEHGPDVTVRNNASQGSRAGDVRVLPLQQGDQMRGCLVLWETTQCAD
ncbi:MAG: response regulator [Planctomycetaceae bacterium]|nr:response regulator [Planctomycetaceae bacterium]